MCLLSVKTVEEQIIVRKTNPHLEENKVLKEQKKGGRTTKLSPMSKDLNLRNPT